MSYVAGPRHLREPHRCCSIAISRLHGLDMFGLVEFFLRLRCFNRSVLWWKYIYIYMGAARFQGPPNLHDLQSWFKQLILQLPSCICIVQHVT